MELLTTPRWYRERRYVHFDGPLSVLQATALVTAPDAVSRHSFWPLLGFRRRDRRWSKNRQKFKTKVRPIAYAAHSDAHIFAYYAWQLGALYEARIQENALHDVVLAYRKHDRGDGRGKANYHFAADAFVEILDRGECDVIGIDVTKFFDSIPHKQVKEQWKRLLDVAELPKDHYAVFKAATKFALVPLDQARKQSGIGRRAIRRLWRFPLSGRGFRQIIRQCGLVSRNVNTYGIPQGLPVSGLLANLVMLDADKSMHETAQVCGASYRRYSDDILLICPPDGSAELEALLECKLSELGLKTQSEKTLRVRFRRGADGALLADRPLQYLGFMFDGGRILVRPQTLTRFLKRVARAVRRAKNSARESGPDSTGRYRIRRRDLYARYSHLGPHRESRGTKIPRGSFLRYIGRADQEFNRNFAHNAIVAEIKRQLRPAWKYLERRLKSAEEELNAGQ